MPDIFRGIHLNPLAPSSSFFLLWMLLGYAATGSVLLVTLGRLGDQFGRVKLYNLGFLVYTMASFILAADPFFGTAGAWWLLGFRIMQAVGGAFIVANSAAILTDTFPVNQRGMALGINNLAGMSGAFIGLLIGGLLGPVDWRLVFFISVPFGLFGTVWSYKKLRELGVRSPSPIDWRGNLTFAGGLLGLMIAVTFGIQPYGNHPMGWTSPRVIAFGLAGVVLLALFFRVESRAEHPMFRLSLYRIRAFTFGTVATFLAALARGGLQFMLVIWLQGIWLPEHGISFAKTPIWAGICMLPITCGMMLASPIAGRLSDRYGSRQFASGGMVGACVSFFLLLLLPVDFAYPLFAFTLFLSGLSFGVFNSPNRASVMNSLPREHRGAGGAMNSTGMQCGQVFSQGVFFTLMIIGLATALPKAIGPGLRSQGVSLGLAQHIAHLPPVSILFATFLGYNPLQKLLGARALAHLPASAAHLLTGREYFPSLISAPFHNGLHEVFTFSIVILVIAAVASWSRGERYVHVEEPEPVFSPSTSGELVTGPEAEVALGPVGSTALAAGQSIVLPAGVSTNDGRGPGELPP
jgi:MFS family permease